MGVCRNTHLRGVGLTSVKSEAPHSGFDGLQLWPQALRFTFKNALFTLHHIDPDCLAFSARRVGCARKAQAGE